MCWSKEIRAVLPFLIGLVYLQALDFLGFVEYILPVVKQFSFVLINATELCTVAPQQQKTGKKHFWLSASLQSDWVAMGCILACGTVKLKCQEENNSNQQHQYQPYSCLLVLSYNSDS